ncbi:MAG: FAD-dependent oxidoreductase [Pseudonocardiaceae bacterium]
MNPVAVIGAGPYGLSTAAHLRAHGLPVRIFGDPLASWRENMPAGMVLKSSPAASTISAPQPGHTLQDFCDAMGEPRLQTDRQVVPIDTFIRYGMWFKKRLVPDVEQVRVAAVDRRDGGLHLKLDSGEQFRAKAVVVATGLIGFAHLPAELAAAVPGGPAATGVISHSSQHADLGRFAGREVVVVGAGQSALESAALLHEAGASVRILVRGRGASFGDPPASGLHWQPDTPLGRAWSLYAVSHYAAAFRYLPVRTRLYLVRNVLGPKGAWWLKDRVAGHIPVLARQRITGARVDGRKAVLMTLSQDGLRSEVSTDHVLAATGYRVDLEALGYLGSELRAMLARTEGAPRLDASFQSSVPGLYFTGLPSAATFGPVLRFVCGTEFASPRVAAAVAQR